MKVNGSRLRIATQSNGYYGPKMSGIKSQRERERDEREHMSAPCTSTKRPSIRSFGGAFISFLCVCAWLNSIPLSAQALAIILMPHCLIRIDAHYAQIRFSLNVMLLIRFMHCILRQRSSDDRLHISVRCTYGNSGCDCGALRALHPMLQQENPLSKSPHALALTLRRRGQDTHTHTSTETK